MKIKKLIIICLVLVGLTTVSAIGPEMYFDIPSGFETTDYTDSYVEMVDYDYTTFISIIDGDQRSLSNILNGLDTEGWTQKSQRSVTINGIETTEYFLTRNDGNGYVYSFNFNNHPYTVNVATLDKNTNHWNIESSNNPVNEIISSFR